MKRLAVGLVLVAGCARPPADPLAGRRVVDLSHAYDEATIFWPTEDGFKLEKDIHAVGLDTPSIDFGQSKTFETHRILFEHDVPAFENVASLEALPASGAFVVALPMKIRGGSGGPLRIVAFVR